MSPERKQLFFTQLREKRAELKKRKLLHGSRTTVSSQEFDRRAPKRRHTQRNVKQQNAEQGRASSTTNVQRDERGESKKQLLLHLSSTIVSPLEVGSYASNRCGLRIINPSSSPEEGIKTPTTSNKGKSIVDYFTIFEVGKSRSISLNIKTADFNNCLSMSKH
ncbi:uncharacterized protein LOC132066665 [Lycium ferocissimum]|uniref:uncharacterized protein LOC132066665 n=1 Tax=Lycium ferocissimum TaxID=112874 RepID=UPI00281574A5|nr:uncharacterized protein LOC132066665 [Lycium ferocissimum]